MKKAAVSHVLSSTEYMLVTDNPNAPSVDAGVTQYWIVGEVPPTHTVSITAMLIAKYVEMYGTSWLGTLMHGVMFQQQDRQMAISMVKAIGEELERG
jgi:hypothetical protein